MPRSLANPFPDLLPRGESPRMPTAGGSQGVPSTEANGAEGPKGGTVASTQLIRQWTLLQELAAARWGRTTAELARAVHASERTVRRDLHDLEAAGFPIEREHRGREVRYRLARAKALPNLPLTLDEALALHQAAVTAAILQNPAFHHPLESAVAKLLQALPPGVRNLLGRIATAWSHRPPPSAGENLPHILRVLAEQTADRCRVRLRYQSLEGEITERVVDPYLLRQHGGEVYLLAHCHLRNQVRLFHTERILDAEPLDEEFTPPAGFDPEEEFAKSLGVFLGPEGHAVVRFEGWAARYLARRPLHPRQEVLERSDGHLVVRVPVRGKAEITQTVLRFGPLAELLAPPDLRAHVATQARATAERYGRNEEDGQ